MPAPDADQLRRWLDVLEREHRNIALRAHASMAHQPLIGDVIAEMRQAWRDAIEAEARAS